jgi:hypothetical protein
MVSSLSSSAVDSEYKVYWSWSSVGYGHLMNDLANDLDFHIVPCGALLVLLICFFDVWSEVTYILL